ncbi:MAG: hypothetical protein RMM06_01495 [Armatimonadota bacterium]|nr:hypothetical protein [Armatimonadota bacterium]
MHHPQEDAQNWMRAVGWRLYFSLRRGYLWGLLGTRVLAAWAHRGVSRAAHWILQRTDPLAQCRRQREQFLAFYEHYEQLVDLLCWAARDTVHDGCDEQYQRVRAWLRQHYAPLRKAMAPFIRQVLLETGGNPQQDPFEPLFAPTHVMQVIESDAGDLLGRIIITRDIVTRYDAHLRAQLERYGQQVGS